MSAMRSATSGRAGQVQISTWLPSSTTRLVGSLKNSIALSALRSIQANSFSRQIAMPGRAEAIRVCRARKKLVSIILNCGAAGLDLGQRGRDVDFLHEAIAHDDPEEAGAIILGLDPPLAGTKGTSSIRTVSSMTRSCSTLLCLRLCSSACGTPVIDVVMNTAVPGTRAALVAADLMNTSIGKRGLGHPVDHQLAALGPGGEQGEGDGADQQREPASLRAPSAGWRRNRATSMVKKTREHGDRQQPVHFHRRSSTTEISTPSISIAPVTAMP